MRWGQRFVVLGMLSVATVVVASEWSNHRFDAAHTAYKRDEVFNPADLSFRWSQYIGNTQPPVISNDKMFVVASTPLGYELRAYDLRNTANLWATPVKSQTFVNGPVLTRNRLFVTGVRNLHTHLEAYTDSGVPLWITEQGDQWLTFSIPVVAGNRIYMLVSGFGGDIEAYNVLTGRKLWAKYVIGSNGTPAVGGGILFATYPGQFYALDAATGAYLWRWNHGISGGGGRTPTVGRLVYMLDHDYGQAIVPPAILAFQPQTGEAVWQWSHAMTGLSDLALTDSALLVTHDSVLWAIDPLTGMTLWSFTAPTPLTASPVVAGNTVFVGSASATYAVNLSKQQEVWSAAFPGSIVIANGWVLISDGTGRITAYYAAKADK